MGKVSRKEQDAKTFESALSAESKLVIERILESLDPHSYYGVHESLGALKRIIGERASIFLRNLLSARSLDGFVEHLDLRPETIKYITYLFAVYGPKLHGIIDATILETPDSLCSSALISTRYDFETKEPIFKIEIVKDSKETMMIEDSADSLLFLSANIIQSVLDNSSKIAEFRKDLGIKQKTISRLRQSVRKLDQLTSPKQK